MISNNISFAGMFSAMRVSSDIYITAKLAHLNNVTYLSQIFWINDFSHHICICHFAEGYKFALYVRFLCVINSNQLFFWVSSIYSLKHKVWVSIYFIFLDAACCLRFTDFLTSWNCNKQSGQNITKYVCLNKSNFIFCVSSIPHFLWFRQTFSKNIMEVYYMT